MVTRRALQPRRLWRVMLACASWTSLALADAPLDVAWQAPMECPSKGEVERRLLELRMRDTGRAALAVHGTIEKRVGAPGYNLRLETKLNGRAGTRDVEGPTCEQVTEAGIAVLALLLDVEAEREEQPETAKPETAKPETAKPETARATPVRAVFSAPHRARAAAQRGASYFVGSGIAAGVGILPGLGVGFEARFGARLLGWNVHTAVGLWPTRAAHASSLRNAGAEISMTSVGLSLCRELPVRTTLLRVCGGLEAERLLAHGFGALVTRSVSEVSPTVVGGVGFSRRLGFGVALSADLEAILPLLRPRFVLDNIGPVFERPAVGARTTLGIEVAF